MQLLASNYTDDFLEKTSYLLKHMYANGGKEYQKFNFLSISDYKLARAVNAAEFEAVIEHTEANGWIKWEAKQSLSLERVRYQGVQLTPSGIEEAENANTLFDEVSVCPLTGLPIEGKATFTPVNRSNAVQYTFKPIGRALFKRRDLMGVLQAMAQGNYAPNVALAGICREAYERKQPAVELANGMLYNFEGNYPKTFEEKRTHFLHLLSDTGGNEYKERTIDTFDDFPMAFADDAKQFFGIIKSLLAEKLIQYNESCVVRGDWVNDTQAHYHDVLLTPAGLKAVISTAPRQVPSRIVPSLVNLHPTVQQTVERLFADSHYRQAVLDACIALDKAVQIKAHQPANLTGKTLMTTVFSATQPVIRLSQDNNEQLGFMNLYQGSAQAMRNHYAHNLTEIAADRALEWLSFISALFYKLDEAPV